MDHSSYEYQYQYQCHHHNHRQQQQQEVQSQIQAYVQSTQSSSLATTEAYYYERPQYQHYPHDYRPEHNLLHQPTSGHPPGVPVPPDLTHFGSSYYPSVDHMRQVNRGLDVQFSRSMQQPQTRQFTNKGGSSRGGRPFQGHAGGHFVHLVLASEGSSSPICGRKHKQVGGKHFLQHGGKHKPADDAASLMPPSVSVPGNEASQMQAAVSRLPSRLSWCELCRVDCNTEEILGQHKNGKKHKKNLRMQEQLENHNQLITGKSNVQMPNSDSRPRTILSNLVVASTEEENPSETETSLAVSGSKINETNQPEVTDLNCEVSLYASTLQLEKKPKDHFGQKVHGVKRKKSGGRGGKHAKTNAGPRRLVDSVKPKEALYGEVGLQALYPPDLSAASTSLISQIQQGISDPHAVLAQLLSYVLTQAPGLLGTQVPGLAVTPAAVTPPSMATSTPVPCSTLDPQNQTNMTRGSETETGTATVITGGENQPSSCKTDFEAAVTGSTDANGNVAGTSASAVKNVTPPMGGLDVEAAQISSASVAEKAVLAAEPTFD